MRKELGLQFIIIWLSFLLSLGLPSIAYSRETQRHPIEIVAIDDSEATHRIVADLRKHIPNAQILSDPAKYIPKSNDTIFITIGPGALRSLLSQNIDGKIIAAFTSSQTYMSILASSQNHIASVTAIYAEPSPFVQLRLISMLYKKPTKIAVLLSKQTAYLEPILQAVSKDSTTLTIERVDEEENLNRALNRVAEVPVILAMPDSIVYNVENIRYILITSYRRKQSVIGFSAPLVEAGALASSYSNIEDIDAQIDEFISELEASGKLPVPQFPKYFGVIVNDDVARSLNIVVDESVRKFSNKPAVKQP